MQHQHVQTICDYLEHLGATAIRVEKHKRQKHKRIIFTWNGAERSYVTAATSSDRRAALRAKSDLRHLLGLIVTEKRTGERRVFADKARPRSSALPAMTALPDGMAALGAWRPRANR